MYIRLISAFLTTLILISHSYASQSIKLSAIENSDNSNISELVLREAYGKLGFTLYITPLPAKRSLHHANEGMADGELFRITGMEKKFPNLIKVPVPINSLDGVAVTRKVDFTVAGWDSLKPYFIAIRRGVKFSDTGTKDMKRIYFNSNIGLGRILIESKGVDIAVMARVNALKTLQHLREVKASTELRILEPAIASYPLFHYLHKKHAHLVPKLTQILDAMHASGRTAEIRKDYLTKKYPLKNGH